MSKTWQWVIGICVVVVTLAAAAALVVPLFLPPAAAGWGGMPHMARGGGMMGGFGRGGGTFMGAGRLLGPLAFVGLIVLGVVMLVRVFAPARPAGAVTPPLAPATPAPCAHCGQPLLAGWKACPYCGEKL